MLRKFAYEQNINTVDKFLHDLCIKYQNDIYFNFMFNAQILKYSNSKYHIHTNFKNTISESFVQGTLSAYKLFYVGCSRAKKELKIIVNKDDIVNYYENFKEKMNKIGFLIYE